MTSPLKNKLLQFDRAVPRYTSYPTAPNFKPIETRENPYLRITNDKTISLYIHIPFCSQMCWYCGCHTKITKRYDPVAEYVSYLLREIDLVASSLPSKGSVSHIHFGGGSPSMLSPDNFRGIMNSVERQFSILPDAEIAIEIDPRGVTEEKVKAYADCGVNRVSLGVQDFNDTVMDAVNRHQPYILSFNAVTMFREYGIDRINLDLIYGLPHQTTETTTRTVELALTLDPDRIAFFGYAHVPWLKKHMRLIDESHLPDKVLRFDLFKTGADIMEKSGYIPVGIDHFIKQDDPMAHALDHRTLRRNFQGYTTDQANIMIGLGISSIGKTDNFYLQNTPDMPIYEALIEEGHLPVVKACGITKEDKLRGEIIERIMCDFEINLSDYEGDYTNELQNCQVYAEAGLISIKGAHISISMQARPIARLVAAAFDQYLPPATEQKHSAAI